MPAPKAPRTFFLAERHKAERRYRRAVLTFMKEVEKRIAGLDDPSKIIAVLHSVAQSPQFTRLCLEASQQIVTMLAVGQKSTWRRAASASSKGRAIYNALRAETTNSAIGQAIQNIVIENSTLIKTVPQNVAARFSELARQRQFEGIRPNEIAKEMLEQAPHLSEVEAKRIARTESAKASTALVQARSEAIGLDFYVWETAGDGTRVRPSHRIMDGVICRWSDPPNPEALAGEKSYGSYHPGGIFNCRCIALPIVDISDISFPVRVHVSGSIQRVSSLKQFKDMFGIA